MLKLDSVVMVREMPAAFDDSMAFDWAATVLRYGVATNSEGKA